MDVMELLLSLIHILLSNGLVALSSALLAQYQGFADVNMGRGAIVIGLAAVIIGEVIFGKVFRNFALKMLAVAIGAILYYLVYQVVIWQMCIRDSIYTTRYTLLGKVPVIRYVCCGCGYVENWVDSPMELVQIHQTYGAP